LAKLSPETLKARKIWPLPDHVAIIMDGNGRWAKRRGLPRIRGHRSGTENIRKVVECFSEHQVPYLTLYAFSTENWARPKSEVRGLFDILAQVIDRESKELHRKGVRLRHLGRIEGLAPALQAKVRKAVDLTKDNTRLNLSIAFDYGGRAEIVEAVRRIVHEGIAPEAITESTISSHLYTTDIPEPDLIIRTGGEMRLSNFLIWQSAYSEYYSTPTLWPDFDAAEIEKALLAYSGRERRFGGLRLEGGEESGPTD
jgi:undecaprenyl diphosphate synthase